MSESPQFRAQARSFKKQGLDARRAAEREELLALARLWDELADEVEQSEQRLAPPSRPRRAA